MSGGSTLGFSLPAAGAATWTFPRKCLGSWTQAWTGVPSNVLLISICSQEGQKKPELVLSARRSLAHDTGGFVIRTRSSWALRAQGPWRLLDEPKITQLSFLPSPPSPAPRTSPWPRLPLERARDRHAGRHRSSSSAIPLFPARRSSHRRTTRRDVRGCTVCPISGDGKMPPSAAWYGSCLAHSQPQHACPPRALPHLPHARQYLRPRAVTEIHPTLGAQCITGGSTQVVCIVSGMVSFWSLLICVGDDFMFCGVDLPSLWEDAN
ncbi:hypothetical protein DFH08DRAFT_384236 [Mycena albidolilacea]|uniref:Uncharacterized protein n=1 Tax=Mycena albidolilacea TaxID=1033008 RepID=A0AAD6ZG10_9AGAR|nr:hypothetical protein DFH08DRAFT_384236 [Mycena albidolilacea]